MLVYGRPVAHLLGDSSCAGQYTAPHLDCVHATSGPLMNQSQGVPYVAPGDLGRTIEDQASRFPGSSWHNRDEEQAIGNASTLLLARGYDGALAKKRCRYLFQGVALTRVLLR